MASGSPNAKQMDIPVEHTVGYSTLRTSCALVLERTTGEQP